MVEDDLAFAALVTQIVREEVDNRRIARRSPKREQ